MNPPQAPEMTGAFFSGEAIACPPRLPCLGELAVWADYGAHEANPYAEAAAKRAPEELAAVVTQFAAPEAYSQYILLDRCSLALSRRQGASTEQPPENEVTQLRRSLSQWGEAGDNARLIVSELVANHEGNTDDVQERWLMVFFNAATNRLELEYHCFEPVSTKTFRNFRKAFRLSGPALAEKLYAGRDRGRTARAPKHKQELSDAGRGRALQVASSDKATIERHRFHHNPARTLPAIQRGAQLSFKVRSAAPKREEIERPTDDLSEEELLAQFEEI